MAAPNFTSDPNGGPFDDLAGNLIQINLTPQTNHQPPKVLQHYRDSRAGEGTYGVAVEPATRWPLKAAQADRPAAPVLGRLHQPRVGSHRRRGASTRLTGTKTTIPLDLDPADDPNNPLYNYVRAGKPRRTPTRRISRSHNAGGIAFVGYTAPDGTLYAFVAGRADEVTSVTGGGNVGDDLIASAVSGFLDQELNPLFEDGNVAIIKNPLGDLNDPNPALRPMVVGATRPVPYGYPVDLALSPPDANGQQFLYVSYQGLPTAPLPSTPNTPNGPGALFIFNATAMIDLVTQLSRTTSGALDLDQIPVDDITMANGAVRGGPEHDHRRPGGVRAVSPTMPTGVRKPTATAMW